MQTPPPDLAQLRRDPVVEAPVLWMEEPDESTRWRIRALVAGSVVFHVLLILSLPHIVRLMPAIVPVSAVESPLFSNRELTYIDSPPDNSPKPAKTPDSKYISDRDRIAQSRTPTINHKELKDILDSSRPGPPGAPGTPSAPAVAAAPPAPPSRTGSPQGGTPQAGAPAQQQPSNQQVAGLQTLPRPGSRAGRGPFGGEMSASTSMDQATRAAAAARGAGGTAGDYGLHSGQTAGIRSGVEITSDTMGVDFGPYLARVLHDVRENWYNIIPEVARPPLMKQGNVTIEFAILKDGKVAGLRMVGSSGDVALDRAAWGGISASNPFPPLPNEFSGKFLALRFKFLYNPDKSDLR